MVCQADDIAQRDPPACVMYSYVTVRHGICHGVSGRRRSAARATCGVCVLFFLCVARRSSLQRGDRASLVRLLPPAATPPHRLSLPRTRRRRQSSATPPSARARLLVVCATDRDQGSYDLQRSATAPKTQNTQNTHKTIPSFVYE